MLGWSGLQVLGALLNLDVLPGIPGVNWILEPLLPATPFYFEETTQLQSIVLSHADT